MPTTYINKFLFTSNKLINTTLTNTLIFFLIFFSPKDFLIFLFHIILYYTYTALLLFQKLQSQFVFTKKESS